MRLTFPVIVLLLSFGTADSSAQAPESPLAASPASKEVSGKPIQVVATFPVLKDLVEQIGKERVQVTSLLSGLESEHTYTPRPTDILAVRKARMLVQVGLGLEIWVDALIKNAANPELLIVTTSKGVPLLKVRENHAPSHSLGDPHIWLDPENAKLMVRHITKGLVKIDPVYKKRYMNNQAAYFIRSDKTSRRLMVILRTIKNRKIITHHGAWTYFAKRFKFQIRGNIITQVGAEPSGRHLAKLIRTIKTEKIRAIISEPQLNPKLPRLLARETGARVVVLTPIPGALPGTETYHSMIEYNIRQLVEALKDQD